MTVTASPSVRRRAHLLAEYWNVSTPDLPRILAAAAEAVGASPVPVDYMHAAATLETVHLRMSASVDFPDDAEAVPFPEDRGLSVTAAEEIAARLPEDLRDLLARLRDSGADLAAPLAISGPLDVYEDEDEDEDDEDEGPGPAAAVAVDSGRVLLVDPCHLPADLVDRVTTPNAHGVTVAALLGTPHGDGIVSVWQDGGGRLSVYAPGAEVDSPDWRVLGAGYVSA